MHNFTKLYRMDLPHRAISVYIYLADRANKDGICWPSISTVADTIKEDSPPGHSGLAESGADSDRATVPGERQQQQPAI